MIGKLISIEWAKFSRSKAIVLSAVLFLIFLPLSMYFLGKMPELPSFLPGKFVFFSFPTVWEYLGYAGNWLSFFFLGILVIFLISMEVSYKTLRQTIIFGFNRKEYFLSKLYVIFLIAFVAALYFTFIGLVLGIANTELYTFKGMWGQGFPPARFFLMAVGYMTFALFIAILIRNGIVAMLVYLVYVVALEPLIRMLIFRYVTREGHENFPMNSIEDLLPLPFFKFAEFMNNSNDEVMLDLLTYQEATVFTVVYIILWTSLGYFILMKKDL